MTPLDLHCRMLKVRRSEELLASIYPTGVFRTPTHFGIGSEAVAAGVAAALQPGDAVFCHHRSHAPYLAMGGSFRALCAELYGKDEGCSGGRGGSVHLTAKDVGYIASTAILGECVALAVGAALAFKMDGKQNVAVAFFGDAAMEEGIVSEAFLFAALHHLPFIAVCEDNGWSTETPPEKRQPCGTTLKERAEVTGVETSQSDGRRVDWVFDLLLRARDRAVEHGRPQFIRLQTDRWLEHVGPHYDHEQGRTFRTAEDLARWKARDPLALSYDALSAADKARAALFDAEWQRTIRDEATAASEAPSPLPVDLFRSVW